MAENFYTILTATGKAKLANSQVTGTKVDLSKIAVGDGNGSYYNPTVDMTALKKEVWRGNISSIKVDSTNPNWIVIEGIVPATDGGFMVREVGIFDTAGDMIAIGKYPETYKPVLNDGTAKDLFIRMIIEVSSSSTVTLKIDPTVVIASRSYVDNLVTPLQDTVTNHTITLADHAGQLADIAIDAKQFNLIGGGIVDDSLALKNAIIAAKNKKLVVPFGKYRLASLCRVDLANNDSIHIDFRGSTLLLDTDDSAWEVMQIGKWAVDNGCSIVIENANIIGINMVAETHWGASTKTYKKNVPFALAAETIKFKNVHFKDIWGFGAKFSYYNIVEVDNAILDNVGGHSYLYDTDPYGNVDAFGDAFYLDFSCGDAKVFLSDIHADGMVNPTPLPLNQTTGAVSNLSRAFCVFENTGRTGSLTVYENNCHAENYQRMWHFEQTPNATLILNDFIGKNGGLLVENYQSQTLSELVVKGTNVEYTQVAGERFSTVYGMGGYYKGEFFGGSFTGLGKSFDGNIDNEDLGYNITFNKSKLYFDNSRLHGAGGKYILNDCDIYDYNDSLGHPYLSINYNSCRFDTTLPETKGLTICPSSGIETFNNCLFINQQPSIANTNNVIRSPRYINDNGATGGMRVLANAQGKSLPKIWNCLYRFTDLNDGSQLVTFVSETGTIYAISGVIALVGGANDYTVNTSANLSSNASYVVEIVPLGKAI